MMLESLTLEEFNAYLAYGEPLVALDTAPLKLDKYDDNDSHLLEASWISTLDSTTYPGLTFGYFDAL